MWSRPEDSNVCLRGPESYGMLSIMTKATVQVPFSLSGISWPNSGMRSRPIRNASSHDGDSWGRGARLAGRGTTASFLGLEIPH